MKLPDDSEKKRPAPLLTHDLFALEISVSGPAASGKSTVAFIIEEALREAGALVTVETDDRWPSAYRETLDSRKQIIKLKRIVVRENPNRRSCRQ